MLLLLCFLLNITAGILWHKWVGLLSREKHPLQQLPSKKGGGCIFEGELIFKGGLIFEGELIFKGGLIFEVGLIFQKLGYL